MVRKLQNIEIILDGFKQIISKEDWHSRKKLDTKSKNVRSDHRNRPGKNIWKEIWLEEFENK